MKILLISGHGAGDPGACATIDGAYYREADLTVEVVTKLEAILREQYGAEVDVYDKSRDAYQDYKAGVLRIPKADYLLEIHFNACVKDYSGNGYTTGTEIYWPSRGQRSGKEDAILRHVCALGLKNRGAQAMGLAVINTAAGSGVKANLLEVCFIDDADDMRLYLKNKDAVAQAIADGVAEGCGLTKAEKKPPADPWYIKDGSWAKATELGIVDGTRPGEPVTRAEANVMMQRYIKAVKEGKV